jgi:hypothetical protein
VDLNPPTQFALSREKCRDPLFSSFAGTVKTAPHRYAVPIGRYICQFTRQTTGADGGHGIPPPDTWEELVHDGTDWLLAAKYSARIKEVTQRVPAVPTMTIRQFRWTRLNEQKLANLRSRMATEAMRNDWTDELEAATVRYDQRLDSPVE